MKNSFHERKNILGSKENYGFWKDFKEAHPEYKDIDNKDLTELTHGFFEHAGELIVNSQHGIILNGLGYFANASFANRKVLKFGNKIIVNMHDDNIYTSYFFPRIFKGNPFNSWNFKLYSPLRRKMKNLIMSGVDYKCHYDILKTNASGVKYYINDK